MYAMHWVFDLGIGIGVGVRYGFILWEHYAESSNT